MPATERLLTEPLTAAHAAELFAALDHPEVGTYLGGPDVTTVDAMVERIAHLAAGPGPAWPDEKWWNFVVRRADSGDVIGRIEATTYGDWGEVAYVFGPASWGAGYATEAMHWLIEFAQAQEAVDLWAAVHPLNDRSIRLLTRLGFTAQPTPPQRPLGSYDEGDDVFRLAADLPGQLSTVSVRP